MNLLKDGLHKVLSPSTYPCRFCDLTWGIAGQRRRWKAFIDELPLRAEFLHRDEFERRYPGVPLNPPCAYRIADEGPVEVIGRDSMQRFESLEELEQAVRAVL